MNPFVDYIAHHPGILADHQPLSQDEQDELFDALNQPDLPDECMTAEMADGFLTGCALSPHPMDMADWLEEVFGQASMPPCGSPQAKDRLLGLVLRRWRDIQHAFTPDGMDKVMNQGSEPLFAPLVGHIDPDDVVHPVQFDADERRLGEWLGRDWAVGFFSAIQCDDTWKHLLEDEDHWPLVGPVLLFFQGYDAQDRARDLDNDPDALLELVLALYRISRYWHDFKAAMSAAQAGH
jgi:uncharacterized protein